MAGNRDKFGILFVCLGNICRSPLGEGICVSQLKERSLLDNFHVDSCGTGSWHVGSPPHKDSQRVAKENGINISKQVGRTITPEDGEQFSLLLAMDRANRRDIKSVVRKDTRVHCLREFDPEQTSLDVPDPYYGGPDGFQEVFEIVDRSVERLIDSLCEELKL